MKGGNFRVLNSGFLPLLMGNGHTKADLITILPNGKIFAVTVGHRVRLMPGKRADLAGYLELG